MSSNDSTIFALDAVITTAVCTAALILIVIVWLTYLKEKQQRTNLIRGAVFINALTQVLVILGSIMAGLGAQQYAGHYIYNIGVILEGVLILMIMLVDVQVLKKFSVLDERISPSRISLLKKMWVAGYLLLCGGDVINTFYPPPRLQWIDDWSIYGYFTMAFCSISFDNFLFYWLTKLVLNWRKEKRKDASAIRMKYKTVIIISGLGVATDWIGLAIDFLNIQFGYSTGFYIGVNSVAIAITSMHLSVLLISLSKLTNLALNRTSSKSLKVPLLKLNETPAAPIPSNYNTISQQA